MKICVCVCGNDKAQKNVIREMYIKHLWKIVYMGLVIYIESVWVRV